LKVFNEWLISSFRVKNGLQHVYLLSKDFFLTKYYVYGL